MLLFLKYFCEKFGKNIGLFKQMLPDCPKMDHKFVFKKKAFLSPKTGENRPKIEILTLTFVIKLVSM
jgi:hypothetical protein